MQALAATTGNITLAAKKLGISRRTLHRKINEMKVVDENGGDDRDRQKGGAPQP
jgi:DNA-binding NtrC family response regulator